MEVTTLNAAFLFFALVGGPAVCIGVILLPSSWTARADKFFGLEE